MSQKNLNALCDFMYMHTNYKLFHEHNTGISWAAHMVVKQLGCSNFVRATLFIVVDNMNNVEAAKPAVYMFQALSLTPG